MFGITFTGDSRSQPEDLHNNFELIFQFFFFY